MRLTATTALPYEHLRAGPSRNLGSRVGDRQPISACVSTHVDPQAIPHDADANVSASEADADACPDDSWQRIYAEAVKNLAAIHAGWLEALTKVRRPDAEMGLEEAAA